MGSGVNKILLFVVAVAVLLCIAALVVAIVLFIKVKNTTQPPTQATLPVATFSPGTLPPRPTSPPTTTTTRGPTTPRPPTTTTTRGPTTPRPPLPTTTTKPPTSNSPGWRQVAKMFAQSIDMSVDPCQDFYQFSCGNWIRSHPIPAGQGSAMSFGVLSNQITKILTSQFQANMNKTIPPISHSAVQKAQMVWNRCMNINPANYNGSQIQVMLKAYGGWPMITTNWATMPYSLGYLMGQFSVIFGVDTFISVFTDTNWKKPASGYLLFLDQANLNFPLIYYTTSAVWSRVRPSYVKYMSSVAMILANETKTQVNKQQLMADVNAIADMEYMIATTMSVPVANQRNASTQYTLYNYATIAGNNAWASINWTDYFTQLGLNGVVSANRLMSMPLSITQVGYLNALTTWLKTAQPRLLQNYMLWRLISPKLGFLPGAYKDAYTDYQRDIFGIEDALTMGDMCSNTALGLMGYATSRLYVQNYWNNIPGNPRTALSTMIDTVKASFAKRIQLLSWMDSTTKTSAQAKVNNLVKNVAYPDWILNDTQLNNYYSLFDLAPQDDFMTMLNKANRFFIMKSFSVLNQPTYNRQKFNGAPAIVNAWYQPELNSITFPAGILNPPFFSPQFPVSVNYGAIGVVMGHELTHGFDDQGVQWNGTGFLNPWIDPFSINGFNIMAQCVINEYSHFCYNKSVTNFNPNCISGQRTQGENIADNGGIKAAWGAYKQIQYQNGVEPRLPGWMSEFTQDQLFFMSFAQVWCRNVKLSSVQTQLLVDPHSPAKYRVRGTISNFPQFATAFNCPKNSTMAPLKHCTVW